MADQNAQAVTVVIGVGGIGATAARRVGSHGKLVLADNNAVQLDTVAEMLRNEGHSISTFELNIVDQGSVNGLADHCASQGRIYTVIHTAGLSPTMSSTSLIYQVNLLGTAYIIDAFRPLMAPGSSMVCISSCSAHLGRSMTPAMEKHLATAPTDQLLNIKGIDIVNDGAAEAYMFSKKANILRVQAAAKGYGERGSRINVVSPGIISTQQGRHALSVPEPNGDSSRAMIEGSAMKRVGAQAEVAEVIAFLTGPGASYVTASELLVDGGCTAAILRA